MCARYVVFKEAKEWYAVVLEVNIYVVAKNASDAFEELHGAVHGYVDCVIRNKPSLENINQTQPRHEKSWKRLRSKVRPLVIGVLPVVSV